PPTWGVTSEEVEGSVEIRRWQAFLQKQSTCRARLRFTYRSLWQLSTVGSSKLFSCQAFGAPRGPRSFRRAASTVTFPALSHVVPRHMLHVVFSSHLLSVNQCQEEIVNGSRGLRPCRRRPFRRRPTSQQCDSAKWFYRLPAGIVCRLSMQVMNGEKLYLL